MRPEELIKLLEQEKLDQDGAIGLPVDGFDNVTKPKHYQGKHGLEAMDVIDNFIGDLVGKQAYCWGNVIKYLLRFQQKNGLEDLKKARQHLDWLIEMEEHDENEGTTVVYGADQAVYSFSQRAIE